MLADVGRNLSSLPPSVRRCHRFAAGDGFGTDATTAVAEPLRRVDFFTPAGGDPVGSPVSCSLNRFQIAPEEAALARVFGQEFADFKSRGYGDGYELDAERKFRAAR
jgi:hypothetical protein